MHHVICEWLGVGGNQDVTSLGDRRCSLFLVGGRGGANHLGLAHAGGRGEGGANSGTDPSLGGGGEWNGTETIAFHHRFHMCGSLPLRAQHTCAGGGGMVEKSGL